MPNYRAIARQAALRYGLNPSIFMNQINQESGFRPNAHSSAGAIGIAQFMPGTAAGMHVNPHNPIAALDAAARMDADNLRKYGGSYPKMLSAYNSGNPTAYLDPHFAGGQTYNYVRSIMGGSLSNSPRSAPTLSPAGPQGGSGGQLGGNPQQMVALSLLQAAQNGGSFEPGALMGLAMARQQSQAGAQTFGPQGLQPGQGMGQALGGQTTGILGNTQGLKQNFLTNLQSAVHAVGGTRVRIISGYRTPAHSVAVGGFANDPHTKGVAIDGQVLIHGKWVPLGSALRGVAGRFGLRSGDTPGFFHGGTDPNHVDGITN